MPDIIAKVVGKFTEVNVALPTLIAVIAVSVFSILLLGAFVTKNAEKKTQYLTAAGVGALILLCLAGVGGIISWIQS